MNERTFVRRLPGLKRISPPLMHDKTMTGHKDSVNLYRQRRIRKQGNGGGSPIFKKKRHFACSIRDSEGKEARNIDLRSRTSGEQD